MGLQTDIIRGMSTNQELTRGGELADKGKGGNVKEWVP